MSKTINVEKGKMSTRRAFGEGVTQLGETNEKIFVLDAETGNSTFSDLFANKFPDRFVECFIAEQNMVSVALGLARMGKIPFVSTFAAFLTRAADQIRMSQYSDGNIKFVGTHAGVSIGEDGSSQMALEDISLFRCILGSRVFYPSDGVSTKKLLEVMANHHGIDYLRATRADTDIIYPESEEFVAGGSKTLFSSEHDALAVIAGGITLHEAIKAYHVLKEKNILIRVVDLYSVKPLDKNTLQKACNETKGLIVVEDHYQEGGIYEAVCGSGVITKPVHSLCVKKMGKSGKPSELLEYMKIDASAIVELVEKLA
jgi:transketolase